MNPPVTATPFLEWAEERKLLVTSPFADICNVDTGPVIGIHASYYLEQFRQPAKEPLVAALGGSPLNLETLITTEIKEMQKMGCKFWFFFDGLDCRFDDDSAPFEASISAMDTGAQAFQLYDAGNAVGAIDTFKRSEFPYISTLAAFLKLTLAKHNLPFVVAPFKAHAQMMFAIDNRTIDVVYGPPELFFYGATKIILRINTVHEPQEVLDGTKKKVNVFNPDATTFVWTDLDQCLKVVPEISAETFISAMYMSGSSHLKPFPPLQTNYQGSGVFAAAMDTLRRHNGNVIQACQGMVKEWEDAYMRVATGVKHMAVLFKHDIVRPRTYQETERHKKPPNDLHEITGLRLPEELMYYLYLGMIGPRVLNWLISGKVRVLAPYAGGNSDQYRKLVKDQLQPWRMQALALIAYSINRYFQTKEIATSYWFDGEAEQKINIKDLNSAKEIQSTWRVTGDMLNRRSEALSSDSIEAPPGSLVFALQSLADSSFAAKTVRSKLASKYDPLKTTEEIVANTIWRFLVLREYVDEQHQLTPWGEMLRVVLGGVGPTKEQAEAAFVAVELIKLGHLNTDGLFSGLGFNQPRGSETSLLVARLATMGKMIHPTKGYSGPLSRALLAFHSLVSEVRSSLRDLIEVTLAVLLLEGDGDRVRDDHLEIAQMLPFQESYSAGLGILTKTYLDELGKSDDPTNKAIKEATMEKAQTWMVHTDVERSFALACGLWDAVCGGIKSSGDLLREEDKKIWLKTDEWLSERR